MVMTSCCVKRFMMDPLVGAVCNPKEIWQIVDEMLVAQATMAAAI